MNPATILSTKKINKALAETLPPEIELLQHNFIKIKKEEKLIAPLLPTLIFTSVNAVKFFVENNVTHQKFKAYCLQGRTFQELSKLKNVTILNVAPDGLSLAKIIVADGRVKEVSFLCSHIRRNELPDYLMAHDIKVNEIIAYQTILSGDRIVQDYHVVLFFSPSGVESFFQKNKLKKKIACICIGTTTATALAGYTSSHPIIIAAVPTQEAVLEAALDYLKIKKTNSDDRK